MPLAQVPYNATVAFPVRRGRSHAAVDAFNLDFKIDLLEFSILREVRVPTLRAYHGMHVIERAFACAPESKTVLERTWCAPS